jgi:hypothetical protein
MAIQFLDPELETDLPDEEICQSGLRLVQEESEEFRCERWESEEETHEFLYGIQNRGLYAI